MRLIVLVCALVFATAALAERRAVVIENPAAALGAGLRRGAAVARLFGGRRGRARCGPDACAPLAGCWQAAPRPSGSSWFWPAVSSHSPGEFLVSCAGCRPGRRDHRQHRWRRHRSGRASIRSRPLAPAGAVVVLAEPKRSPRRHRAGTGRRRAGRYPAGHHGHSRPESRRRSPSSRPRPAAAGRHAACRPGDAARAGGGGVPAAGLAFIPAGEAPQPPVDADRGGRGARFGPRPGARHRRRL